MLPSGFSLLRIFIVLFIFAIIAYQAIESDNKYIRVFSLLLVLVGAIYAYFVFEGGVF